VPSLSWQPRLADRGRLFDLLTNDEASGIFKDFKGTLVFDEQNPAQGNSMW